MTRYRAQDGTDVELTADNVLKYIVTDGKPSERDIAEIIAKCAARGLNPLAGDCYVSMMGGRPQIIVSKDYYCRTAREHGATWRAGVVVSDREGRLTYRDGTIVGKNSEFLIGGWAEVTMQDAPERPFRYEVSFAEFDTGKALWKSKPATMIRKVALVSAIREALPSCFGGVYERDEMPEHESPEYVEVSADEVD